jgi:CMP/dCMP kinase
MSGWYHVAIDGFAATGKSTAARMLAAQLKIPYGDTGAMYRAHALLAIESGKNPKNSQEMAVLLDGFNFSVITGESGQQNFFLGSRDISREIRQPAVSQIVSETCKHKAVRSFMVDLQRRMAQNKNLVMEGRDIGTVVLPGARFKFFLTAAETVRAERRFREMRSLGMEMDQSRVLRELGIRDTADSQRANAPLKKAPDAVEIDTTDRDAIRVVECMQKIILKNI